MTRRVVLAARAKRHVGAIDHWWREHRPAAPGLFRQELAAAFELVVIAPQSGRRYRASPVLHVRRVLLRSTRYHVYYVGRDNDIEVLAVWSAVRGTGPDLRF
ncbi:MAG: type II toxin-antitoxin system RelE/ParE family toxin [Deltaproteobacteria bacterium]|nr:type II toxin-antitoxin system RelE/ParE family toxin [Deltaproteobacteria bacterium]